jgi:hypothetical protein
MHLIARLGKTQTHRYLPAVYRRLRRLTTYYDEDEQVLAATRQRIQAVIRDLFPDYNKPATFTFGSTGGALMEAYAFNPYHIVWRLTRSTPITSSGPATRASRRR